jgi:hypothetical protein
MWRIGSALILGSLLFQDADDAAAQKARLHDNLAASAVAAGDQLLKLKAWDEARAFLELIRAKSDARAEALDKLIARTEKQSSGLKWDAKSSDLIQTFGADQAKPFQAFARAWKEKDPEASRWTEAEGRILGDLLDYVKAYARLTQIRAHYELPKTRFDWKLSVPAVWHAGYVVQHPQDAQEIAGKDGYTTEGSIAGRNSVSNHAESLNDLLEAVIHAAFHRIYLFHPNLTRTGFGQAQGNTIGSVIDVHSAIAKRSQTEMVLCTPKDRANDVPVSGYDDHTKIVPGKSMKDLGYPISLIFYDPQVPIHSVRARLTTEMRAVEVYASSPDQPALPNRYPTNKNSILLIPKERLRPKCTYTVSIEYETANARHKREWSFTTGR